MAEINFKELKIGGSLLVSGQIAQGVFAFAVNLLLVRFISPAEFGRFALLFAGTSIIFSILSFRTDVLIIRAADKDFDDDAKIRYFSTATLETLISTLIVVSWIVATSQAGIWEILLVGAIALRHWTDSNKAFFERTMPYRGLAAVETGSAFGAHSMAAVLVLSGCGAVTLIAREVILSVLNLAGLLRLGGVTFLKFRIPRTEDLRILIGQSRGIWLDGLLEGGFQRVTILAAGLLGGDQAAGYFFQAQRLALVPLQFLAPVVGRLASNWYGRTENREERAAGRDKVLRALLLPLILLGVLTYWLADPVVPLLFGEPWARTADLFAALCGMVLFMPLFEAVKSYSWSVRALRHLLFARLAQYLGLVLGIFAGYAGILAGDLALAGGLSAAYGLAFMTIFLILKFAERRWH